MSIQSPQLETYLIRLLDGNVFTSVHEHLLVMVDVITRDDDGEAGGDGKLDFDDKVKITKCIDSVLTIIQLLMNSEKMTANREGRSLLASIVSQLASGGDEISSSLKSQSTPGRGASQGGGGKLPGVDFITSLKQLFLLVEETCSKVR